MLSDDLPGGLVQVAGPGVIAESGPQVQHFILLGFGQILHRRKPFDKTLEIGDHGGDLGLLEHDLRQPDLVRRFVELPGQGFAAKFVVPR